MTESSYVLIGMPASPYSLKMRALMRYRRLDFVWEMGSPRVGSRQIDVKPPLIPILRLPEDGSYHVDSTPLAHLLEERHPGQRSVLPLDPVLGFLNHLIEDMADEWLTKVMFHYRWAYDECIEYCGRWLAGDMLAAGAEGDLEALAQGISTRQIERMPLVGCTPENAPVIEGSYLRLIAILERHLAAQRYLFGSRPALADFALFGQLQQLATDPVPAEIMRRQAQRLYDWLRRNDDASGVEGRWADEPAGTIVELLELAGEIYFPFLQANAEAFAAGADTMSLEINGQPFSQGTFKYQVRCYERLRALFEVLDPASQVRLEPLLEPSGCLAYLIKG
jgi:glutathione S-transferase